uniref:Uncharacterized protein n=1 Tax=Psilocybe cubensis TaxID=181762 RepID=A0A8H8CEG6_PSICU
MDKATMTRGLQPVSEVKLAHNLALKEGGNKIQRPYMRTRARRWWWVKRPLSRPLARTASTLTVNGVPGVQHFVEQDTVEHAGLLDLPSPRNLLELQSVPFRIDNAIEDCTILTRYGPSKGRDDLGGERLGVSEGRDGD